MLTEKQEKFFIEFYKKLYWEPKDENGNPCIPHCKKSEEAKHEQLWREMVKKMLWKDCKKKYTHRWGRTETWEEMIFNRLYYNYWPYFDLPDDK